MKNFTHTELVDYIENEIVFVKQVGQFPDTLILVVKGEDVEIPVHYRDEKEFKPIDYEKRPFQKTSF